MRKVGSHCLIQACLHSTRDAQPRQGQRLRGEQAGWAEVERAQRGGWGRRWRGAASWIAPHCHPGWTTVSLPAGRAFAGRAFAHLGIHARVDQLELHGAGTDEKRFGCAAHWQAEQCASEQGDSVQAAALWQAGEPAALRAAGRHATVPTCVGTGRLHWYARLTPSPVAQKPTAAEGGGWVGASRGARCLDEKGRLPTCVQCTLRGSLGAPAAAALVNLKRLTDGLQLVLQHPLAEVLAGHGGCSAAEAAAGGAAGWKGAGRAPAAAAVGWRGRRGSGGALPSPWTPGAGRLQRPRQAPVGLEPAPRRYRAEHAQAA